MIGLNAQYPYPYCAVYYHIDLPYSVVVGPYCSRSREHFCRRRPAI